MKLKMIPKKTAVVRAITPAKAARVTTPKVAKSSRVTVPPPAAVSPKHKGEVIAKGLFDKYEGYVARRIPVSAIASKVIGQPIPKLGHHGYLVVHGDKPGILVRDVMHDAEGNYYKLNDGGLYGSVVALNSTGRKGFKAEIIDKEELLALAKKSNRCYELTHVGSGNRVTVWLLCDYGNPYFAGVTKQNGHVAVLNMEHPNAHNKKNVQYNDPKVIKQDFQKFFGKVA